MTWLGKGACLLVLGAWVAGTGAAEPGPTDYPPALPPQQAAMLALAQSPLIVAGREQVAVGIARQQRLRAGPYEWEVAATTQQRKDAAGLTFAEQQYELTRRWRLPGKGSLDRRIGALAASVGENAFADAWHEAGRSLLAEWFSWQREERLADLLARQVELAQREVETVSRRVTAGDAPRLDLQRAQAEQGRIVAQQLEGLRRAQAARLELERDFPAFDLSSPATRGEPQPVGGSEGYWIERIVRENHEIELAQGKADEAALQATRARRDRLADPSIGLQFSDNLDQNRQVVGLRIAIPIGGTGRGADAALARSHAHIAAAEAEQVRLGVRARAQLAVVNAHSAFQQWKRLADVARDSTAAAEGVARGYAVGELGLTDLLAARRQQIDAQLLAVSAELTAHESFARLRLDAHDIWALEEARDRQDF